MTNDKDILHLISTYLNNPHCSVSKLEIEQFRALSKANDEYFKEIERIWNLSASSKVLRGVNASEAAAKFRDYLNSNSSRSISLNKKVVKRTSLFPNFLKWAAAAVLFICGIALTLRYSKTSENLSNLSSASQILPGGNKAFLTLADGSRISLDDASTGDLSRDNGIKIIKGNDGQIVYQVVDGLQQKNLEEFNTIETPKGGMWQVQLPDGSKIWLNAASSISYPTSFGNYKKRVVKLTGEAYFEVAKDSQKSFIVQTAQQEVEVLGTHFNVNSYAENSLVRTTLMEGSVKISSLFGAPSIVLKPGQQALLNKHGITIENVDVNDAIDWKNGYFLFDNLPMESIMKRLARWYDIEVNFADEDAKGFVYYGIISRNESILKILRKFEQAGDLKYEIKQNTVTIYQAQRQ